VNWGGVAFDQERFAESRDQVDGGGKRALRDIAQPLEARDDGVNALAARAG
jgi:hypothetical protein